MSFIKKFFSSKRKSKKEKKYESAFDHEGWLGLFKEASEKRSYDDLHGLRISIIYDTFNRLDAGWYKSYTGEKVEFEKGVHDPKENTKLVRPYDFTDIDFPELPPMAERPFQKTEVFVRNADCVIETLKMLDEGMKPAVINMANANNPGGGYLSGAGAQEENLFRRSNCNNFLDPIRKGYNHEIYPIPLIGGHYVPGVTVFRGPESEGYPLLPEPKKIDVLTVAALSYPDIYFDDKRGEYMMNAEDVKTSYRKICVLYEMARDQKNDGIVLSAIGCGAFRNPPKQVAELFLEATKKYYGFFKQIVFAIFDDHNARKQTNPDGNFLPFKRTFEDFNFDEWNPEEFKEDEVFSRYIKEEEDEEGIKDSSSASDANSHKGKHKKKDKRRKPKHNKKKKKEHEEEEEENKEEETNEDKDEIEEEKSDKEEEEEIELQKISNDTKEKENKEEEEEEEEGNEDKPPEEKREKRESDVENCEMEEGKGDEDAEEHKEKHSKNKHKKHNEEEVEKAKEEEDQENENDENEEKNDDDDTKALDEKEQEKQGVKEVEKEDEKIAGIDDNNEEKEDTEEPAEDGAEEKKEHKHKKHKDHSKKHHKHHSDN